MSSEVTFDGFTSANIGSTAAVFFSILNDARCARCFICFGDVAGGEFVSFGFDELPTALVKLNFLDENIPAFFVDSFEDILIAVFFSIRRTIFQSEIQKRTEIVSIVEID